MLKKFIEHFTIWIKEEIKEKDLEDKPLEYLCIKKQDEYNYFSSKLSTFYTWLWIIIPVYLAVQSIFVWWYAKNIIFFMIYYILSIGLIIRISKLFSDLSINNKITNNNLMTYNKVILKKLKEEEKSEKEYKDKVITTLDKISKNKP